MKPAVGLFAKPAVPGQVKTRLIPPLTPPQAATLYAAFLADVATTLATGNAWDWVVFSTDPQAQRATWPDPAPRPSAWYRQEGPDLGARMDHALTRLLEEGRPAALLVGSDHPTLDPAILTRGVVSLEQAEVVLGPSTDGGYYLVGTTRPQPELFRDMPWSSPEVLGRTLSRIRGLGLRLADLPPWYDVDTPEDLHFLRSHLHALALSGHATRGAASRKALETIPDPPQA